MNAQVADAPLCGRRVCPDWGSGCGGVDMGPAAGLAAGQETHGMCPACVTFFSQCVLAMPCIEVRAHPSGGYTHAVPVGGGTVREYRGWWSTHGAAAAALEGSAQ
jgi:hypothetical protein